MNVPSRPTIPELGKALLVTLGLPNLSSLPDISSSSSVEVTGKDHTWEETHLALEKIRRAIESFIPKPEGRAGDIAKRAI